MNVNQLRSNSYSSYAKISLITLVKIITAALAIKTNPGHLVNHNLIKYKVIIIILITSTLVVTVQRNTNSYSNK